MDKVWKLISLDSLKGWRTKISLLGAGVLSLLSVFGVIDQAMVDKVVQALIPLGLFFAVEHWEPKK
jgi:hypothetical protein